MRNNIVKSGIYLSDNTKKIIQLHTGRMVKVVL